MSGIAPREKSNRLVELDALRGIAATLVMLFHYTTQYDRLFGHESPPLLALPWGHYGVNLFFMISGFVIFMTLHRAKRPMDFIVSRFSRLFPAYWVAVALTFLLVHALALPGKTVSIGTAAMNLFMIHGLFRIPHVDNVYWTLEIELLFYAWAFLLYRLGRLDKVHLALGALLALRLVYFLADKFAGVDLSWTLSHLLILPYIAWFVCGIMLYRLTQVPDDAPRKDFLILSAAVIVLGMVDGAGIGLLAAALSAVIWSAAKGKLPILANPILAWLGAISYTLYLLHENIGWGVIMQLQKAGLDTNLSILLSIALSLALATALTRLIEQPAMKWLRSIYRQREASIVIGRLAALAVILVILFASLVYAWHKTNTPRPAPGNLVEKISQPALHDAVPCRFSSAPRPLMVLVLGQSNAGNHGAMAPPAIAGRPASFFFDGGCYLTSGPAPGATGHGGNLWAEVGPRLSEATGRPVVFSVLAVEATRVQDWVQSGKLRQRLIETLARQRQHGFVPDVVLWQQGEADALAGTTRKAYTNHFIQLTVLLRSQGITAPIIAALSTRCRNNGSQDIREALKNSARQDPTISIGPDTDTLTGPFRYDACHFSTSGLDAATDLWLPAILAHTPPRP